MTVHVSLFTARGCHLCGPAVAACRAACAATGAELVEVDITGHPALEERYRAELPVVEVGGVKAFKFFVEEDALVERIGRHAARLAGLDGSPG